MNTDSGFSAFHKLRCETLVPEIDNTGQLNFNAYLHTIDAKTDMQSNIVCI